MKLEPVILGIDTSCDDTSVAVTRGARVLSNVISSQDDIHRGWGGVVPNLARRAHQENFDKVLALALLRAKVPLEEVDAIAITYGPGLAVSLEVGLGKAQELARAAGLPLIGVNHIEGHLLSSLAANLAGRAPLEIDSLKFPALGLIVSGGHTEIVLIHSLGKYEIIGETVDDALGEAFDKVARMLGLGFPGGATLSRLADQGDADKYTLPIPMRTSGDLNVSYSGLKTAVRRLIHEVSNGQPDLLTRQQSLDIAASFQKAAVQTIIHKVRKSLEKYSVKQILLGGGSAANLLLRQELRRVGKIFGAKVYVPYSRKLCADNGAMIAFVGGLKLLRGEVVGKPETLDRAPQLRLTDHS